MKRRGSHTGFYNYSSPNNHGSSGEEGFRSPRPQYQSSPRVHQHYGGQHSPHGHSGNYHPGISPIAHAPNDSNMRGRHPSMPSPGMQSPNYRGRGGRGRFHSGGHSPWSNRDANPGGSDDISQYFHPSMLEDPWEKLQPVPVSQTPNVRAT